MGLVDAVQKEFDGHAVGKMVVEEVLVGMGMAEFVVRNERSAARDQMQHMMVVRVHSLDLGSFESRVEVIAAAA